MRIISKFHDYYDSIMAYGYDDSLVWLRETEEIKTNKRATRYYINTKSHSFLVKVENLAFCGTYYSIHRAMSALDWHYKPSKLTKIFCTSSVDEMRELIRKSVGDITSENCTRWWHKETDLKTSSEDLHRKYNCPIILVGDEKIIKCPVLKDLQFQRIKDPYTTYQEIAMYLSGVLGQSKEPPVTLSDKSKIVKHGFDPKRSFRK